MSFVSLSLYLCSKFNSWTGKRAPYRHKANNMEQEILTKLEEIKNLTLIAAKSILTIDDVVTLTGFTKSYVYNLTWQRKIPYYKPTGKQIYFDKAEVEAWMRQNRVNTAQEAEQKALHYVASHASRSRTAL